MNSKELVQRTLEFNNNGRAPRQMWTLPWANIYYPEMVQKINRDFPSDFDGPSGYLSETPKTYGDPCEPGEYIDEWGCKFTNIHRGVIGEIKEPLIKGEEWEDKDKLRVPRELLTINKQKINEYCKNSDKYLMAGACPRPFEQLQFMRGTEQLYVDLMLRPDGMFDVINQMHEFYCELLTAWAQTDVDALGFMDDWGSQNTLLISPKIWEEIFKPMYRDYVEIAHRHNKKIFMHSDGNILLIMPHLIEIGVDAVNSQLFCMGLDNLKQFKGKITFWGEMDRQHLLPSGTLDDIENAVKAVKENLWQNGGCIAQCEFGAGANPENVYKVFETWDAISNK